MIEQFLDVLSESACELTYEQIIDSLWLSLQLPRQENVLDVADARATLKRDDVEPLPVRKLNDLPPLSATNTGGTPKRIEESSRPGELFVPNPGSLGGPKMRAAPIRIPAAESLPNKYGINAALRPLKRRYPSSRTNVLDVTATIEQIANGGPAVAIMKPAPERWLDVTLIVDESASMRVWRETIQEFALLLTRHGSFRDVRSWYVNLDETSMKLYSEAGLPGSPRRLRHPKELIDVSGRRLILIASDCVSPGWRGETMVGAILDWGRRGPLALVQMLPERLWTATTLGDSITQFRAYSAGAPNSSLETQRLAIDFTPELVEERMQKVSVPLPVVNLEGWSLAPWAKLVANVGVATAEGVTISQTKPAPDGALQIPEANAGTRPAAAPALTARELTARERVARFYAAASPAARQLAGYLSGTPLCLPVMRLVQKAMMPTVRQVDLAEVLLGGLLQQVPTGTETGRAEDVFYEFLPGVRELLQESVSEADQQRVLREVSRLIENQVGNTIDFSALLSGDWSSLGSLALYPLGQRFAEITSTVLLRLGWSGPVEPDPVVIPETERTLNVLVVGTGSFELPKSVQLAAEQVGAAVANSSANLITGGWPGVDHLAARWFSEAQTGSSAQPVGELLQIVEDKQVADFSGGKVERVGLNEGIAECLRRADLVILVGGAGGTWLAFLRALETNKLILPFLNTGSDAHHAAILLELFGQNVPLALVRADFGNEREAGAAGGRLQILLNDLKTRRAPHGVDNHDLLWMAKKILPLADSYLAKKEDFEGEADAIYEEFKAHTLPEEKYAEIVLAMLPDASPSWRSVAYLAIQARPLPGFVDRHLGVLEKEVEFGLTSNETRPLWRWLVATDSLIISYPSEFSKESVRILENAQRLMRHRSDVDPGGECKARIAQLLRKLNEMFSVRGDHDEMIGPDEEIVTEKAPESDATAPAKEPERAVVPAKKAAAPGKVAAQSKKVAEPLEAATPAKKATAPKKAVTKKTSAKKAAAPVKVAVPAKKAAAKKTTPRTNVAVKRAAKKVPMKKALKK